MQSLIRTLFSNAKQACVKRVCDHTPETARTEGGHTPPCKTILKDLSATS